MIAAQADVAAPEARARQAGYRQNPEFSIQVENFAGTGSLRGVRATETTVSLNQRLDLGGRRSARLGQAVAELVTSGASRRTAAEVVARLTGSPKNDLYRGTL